MRLAVRMHGEFGHEPDCVIVEANDEDVVLMKAKLALLSMLRNVTLSIGDSFKVEEVS